MVVGGSGGGTSSEALDEAVGLDVAADGLPVALGPPDKAVGTAVLPYACEVDSIKSKDTHLELELWPGLSIPWD